MGKVNTSFFRAAEPSSSGKVQYVRPNQTFPTAALIDYVVSNRDAKPQAQAHQRTQKVSFISRDSYKPNSEEGYSGNYLGAPADDCIDYKAANYILHRKLSLQYDSD